VVSISFFVGGKEGNAGGKEGNAGHTEGNARARAVVDGAVNPKVLLAGK